MVRVAVSSRERGVVSRHAEFGAPRSSFHHALVGEHLTRSSSHAPSFGCARSAPCDPPAAWRAERVAVSPTRSAHRAPQGADDSVLAVRRRELSTFPLPRTAHDGPHDTIGGSPVAHEGERATLLPTRVARGEAHGDSDGSLAVIARLPAARLSELTRFPGARPARPEQRCDHDHSPAVLAIARGSALEAPAALAGARGDALEAPAAMEFPPLGGPGPPTANPVSPEENAPAPSGDRELPCASHLPPSVSMLARSVSVATLSAHHAIPRDIESARDVIPDEGGATSRAPRADVAERVARGPSGRASGTSPRANTRLPYA